MSQFWYEVEVYGGTEQEQSAVRHRIQDEFPVQMNGEFGTDEWSCQWLESDMQEFMLTLSAEYPHMVMLVDEDTDWEEDEHCRELYYFGNGKKQHSRQKRFQDAISEDLLLDRIDRKKLPSELLAAGCITVTGAGGLYRLTPELEDNCISVNVVHQVDGISKSYHAIISDLMEKGNG